MSNQGRLEDAVPTKVLVVGMLDSIHVVRWLELFESHDVLFWLIPSSPHRRIHPGIKQLAQANKDKFHLVPFAMFLGAPAWIFDKLVGNRLRGFLVDLYVKIVQPDFVHALEMQNAGYICLRAPSLKSEQRPRLIVTNYGSDIFWFQQFKNHRRKLRSLLELADFYACECTRDIHLAAALGFQGHYLPVIPNAGGFEANVLEHELSPVALRRTIAIKGYWGWAGRANLALEAIAEISQELVGTEVVVFSTNFRTSLLAKKIQKQTGLSIKTYMKGSLTHQEVLDLFGHSLVYVGLSVTDGISTSMLEAMAMGAIPVQSSTACCDEWFKRGGVAVNTLEVQEVASAIKKAMQLAHTTDSAMRNRAIIRSRAARADITRVARNFYSV